MNHFSVVVTSRRVPSVLSCTKYLVTKGIMFLIQPPPPIPASHPSQYLQSPSIHFNTWTISTTLGHILSTVSFSLYCTLFTKPFWKINNTLILHTWLTLYTTLGSMCPNWYPLAYTDDSLSLNTLPQYLFWPTYFRFLALAKIVISSYPDCWQSE